MRYSPTLLAAVGVLVIIPPDGVRAVQPGPIPVTIIPTADDDVGGQLVYRIKEGLRASRGMRYVSDDGDSAVQARIVTLDPDEGRFRSTRTIYSIVWTASQVVNPDVKIYWTNTVGICGASRINECADGLVADTDRVATQVDKAAREFLKTQGLGPLLK